jgi:hypothetical protein
VQYSTTTHFPVNLLGANFGFVLHWREQVAQNEKAELESFPPKQKLRMLQNTVGDANEFDYVKLHGTFMIVLEDIERFEDVHARVGDRNNQWLIIPALVKSEDNDVEI